jgi:hypothetical protein
MVQERARQRKEYEALIAGRDILGTQLVRRNDEVALLYAKLRLQTSALQVTRPPPPPLIPRPYPTAS